MAKICSNGIANKAMENKVNPPPGLATTILYTKKPTSIDNKKFTMVTFSCNIRLPYKKILIALRQALKAKVINVPVELLPAISNALGVGV